MNDNREIDNQVELQTSVNNHIDDSDSLQSNDLNSKTISPSKQIVDQEYKGGPLQLSIGITEDNVQILTINNIDRPNKEIFEFCVKNSLDYAAMEAIQSQINSWIKDNFTLPQQQMITIDTSSNQKCKKKQQEKRKGKIKKTYSMDKKRSYSVALSERSQKEPIRDISQKNIHNLFPYQIGITSCHIQKIKQNSNANKKQSFYKTNPYPMSMSSEERCYTCPTENKNTCSNDNFNSNENPSLTISNVQSKTINELLHNPIIKSNNNNFYLFNDKSNTSSLNENLSFNETINDKSMKYNKKVNYGHIIYTRNMKKMEDCIEKVSQIRSRLNNSQNYTFNPSINPISIKAQKNRAAKAKEYNNPKTILQYKTYSQEKHDSLKNKYESIDNEVYQSLCTFSPAVNHDYHSQNKQKNSSFLHYYEKLYNDQLIKDKKLQELSDNVYHIYPYQPKTLQSNIQMKFDARLVDYQRKLSEKNDKRRQAWLHGQDHDPITNQPLFHPQFESKSTRENKKISYVINNYRKKQPLFYSKEIKKTCINSTSGDLFESKKIASLKRIFSILDSDDDGMISSITMNLKGLTHNIKDILQPLFNEMKDGSDTLKEKEFIEICNKLYQVSPII